MRQALTWEAPVSELLQPPPAAGRRCCSHRVRAAGADSGCDGLTLPLPDSVYRLASAAVERTVAIAKELPAVGHTSKREAPRSAADRPARSAPRHPRQRRRPLPRRRQRRLAAGTWRSLGRAGRARALRACRDRRAFLVHSGDRSEASSKPSRLGIDDDARCGQHAVDVDQHDAAAGEQRARHRHRRRRQRARRRQRPSRRPSRRRRASHRPRRRIRRPRRRRRPRRLRRRSRSRRARSCRRAP